MSTPLFQAYPDLERALPVTRLLNAPTPIEPFAENLWVKRDDETSAVYGGNKVRKLEFVLADMERAHKKRVVTFGALGTNHGVATSTFCLRQGIPCRVLLFEQPVTRTVLANLRQMIANDAQLEYVGSLPKTAARFYAMQAFNRSDYFLPAGGSSPTGCVGFVNAAFELREQIAQGLMPEPDYIVCAVGSSGTLAGLTLGCRLAGLQSRVRGVRVAPSHIGPIAICTPGSVAALIKRTQKLLLSHCGAIPALALPAVDLCDDYVGAGYGRATEEGFLATEIFQAQGITLEGTYTAKAAAAALQLREAAPNAKVLYWHTYYELATAAEPTVQQLQRQPAALTTILNCVE